MPYLNSNNVVIRNSNTMDTVKLVDMLSKLGVIKRKKRRVKRQVPEPVVMENPLASASRFLGSRPLINISNNADSAKIGEADAIRREAFYHVGRLTDAINRQNVRDGEPTRMQPNARIERDTQTEQPEANDAEMQTDDTGIPAINAGEMDRVGPNDETDEMQDDRIIDYAGEGGDGMVDDEDEGDESDWLMPVPIGRVFMTPEKAPEPFQPPESEGEPPEPEDEDIVDAPRSPEYPPAGEETPEPSAVYEPERYIENNQLNRVLGGLITSGFPKLKAPSKMNVNQINELTGQFLRAVGKQFPDDADTYRQALEPIITNSRMTKPQKHQLLRDTIESFARSKNLV
jgi:hypothetical protein